MDEKLKKFTIEIRNAFSDATVLLFGSRAKGTARSDSDYDLIIVSKQFKGIPFANRPYAIWSKSQTVIAADLLCYAPNEVDEIARKSFILKDALKYAVSIW